MMPKRSNKQASSYKDQVRPNLAMPTTASRGIFLMAMNAESPNLMQKSISPERTSTALKEVPPIPK
uniref:Uncharacterized protein n=1 Tax=Fagus sylvatica TaxID=28930 RepID=A0A2N9EY96_FAGSY